MTEQTSKVITALRFPLAVLVIACHSSILHQPAGEPLPGWDSWHFLANMQLFVCEVLPHVAVPLFMLFSGLLLFRHGTLGPAMYAGQLKKKARTLLVPYLIWSTLSFIVAVAQGDISCSFLHWLQGLWDAELWTNGGKFVIGLSGYPMNMPLWFVRDLIILMILSYPIGFLLEKTRGWILLLMAVWWFPGHEKFFGFGADVLFYFSLGAWLSIKNVDFLAFLRKVRIPGYILCAAMIIVESIITFSIFRQTNEVGFRWIPFNVFVISMMVATLNIAYGLVIKGETLFTEKLATCSFFLYVAHYVLLPTVQKALYQAIMPATQLGNIAFFWAFLVGYIVLLVLVFRLLSRFLPRTTAVLTGGRR